MSKVDPHFDLNAGQPVAVFRGACAYPPCAPFSPGERYPEYPFDARGIGGGNAACETALELWRNRAKSVTMVVRAPQLKGGVKY